VTHAGMVGYLDQVAAAVNEIAVNEVDGEASNQRIASLLAAFAFRQTAQTLRDTLAQDPNTRLSLAEDFDDVADMVVARGFD
jgi:hypothetical protein